MKSIKLLVFVSMLLFLTINGSKTKYMKGFLKNFSTKLEVDVSSCKGCMMTDNEKKSTFICPQDKSQKCFRCSINPSKQDGCKKGCFRLLSTNNSPCLIIKNQDEAFKAREFRKTPKPENPEDAQKMLIEEAKKKIFVIQPVEQDILFFLIDSSGSMTWDTKMCHTTATTEEWDQYVKDGNYKPRIKIVKEVLKNKIKSFPANQKYSIWESSKKSSFDNLDGKKTSAEAEQFIENINPEGIFKYEEAFHALKEKISSMNETKKNVLVSLLTDGGISDEIPAESATLAEIQTKGIKKWELFLYSQGGCTDKVTLEKEEKIMKDLKTKVGIAGK